MKRILTLISLMCAFTAFSQQYNNEWIDYTKTYYKFKVGQTGLHRLSQPTLSAAGLGAVPAEQFKLIRNGVEVPVYTSSPTGPLATNGYIEFWGEANDGKADKALYRNPAFQHSDKISLQTDTAMYFLTVSTTPNRRLADQVNNVAGSPLAPEPFFMHTTGNYYRTKINSGFARNAGEYVYSSSYDQGEYWSSRDIYGSSPLSDNITSLPVYTSGPQASLRFGASGNTQNRRRFNVTLNSTQLFESELSIFNDTNAAPIYFPVSTLNGGNFNIVFSIKDAEPLSPLDVNDRAVVSYYELTYPRKFDFGMSRNFSFVLPAKNEGYLLSIANFNKGAVQPVLYDLTYNERYTAVNSATGDSVKFALPGTTQPRNLVLVNEETVNISNVVSLIPKTFVNYTNAARQGDYIIISNPLLYNGANGSNPVNDYRDYRKSADGGGYNATIVEIDELVDQFAFGIKKHPLSVKNFIRFARDKFSVLPKYVFLIGRGVDYVNYRNNQTSALIERLNLIPSFGYPASDNFMSSLNSQSAIPVIPIGRLSTVYPNEVADYLQKMKEYEHTQKTAPNTIKDRLWMKNVMHVTGASQSELGVTLCNFMHGYKSVMDDTLAGTKVSMFCKSSANPVEQLSSDNVSKLFEEGLSMVTYFGHSSSTTLEFNIDNPENYNNAGKYPVFSVNGCNAGNFFTYYPQRFEVNETLSEKFVLAKQRGGIAFLASTHFGIVNYLNIYLNGLYQHISAKSYGESLGLIHERSLKQMVDQQVQGDYFARCHSEEITLHGDPALRMNFEAKADYVLEDPQVKITPAFLSIAENQFELKLKMFNLGKAVNDSIIIEIKRQYPSGTSEIIMRKKIKGILYSDSLTLNVPVISTRDKGANKLIISLDADNSVAETDEVNNVITKEFFVYEDEARPAFPYDFSIINNDRQRLYASTANPLSQVKDYAMEIDTTELFNSPLKKSKQTRIAGGVIEFDPQITYLDSTVYYWRVAMVPATGQTYRWNTFSFIYMKNNGTGVNQSHVYQHLKSGVDNISLDVSDKKWKFGEATHLLQVKNGVFPTAANQSQDISVAVDGNDYIQSVCGISGIIINIINPLTLKPWFNANVGGSQYGSSPVCGPERVYNFQYNILDRGKRQMALNLLDIVPEGYYVIIRNVSGTDPATNTYASDWLGDTTYFGAGNSLYQRFKTEGIEDIDSFNRPRSFIFIYKKGKKASFTPKWVFSRGINDKILLNYDVQVPDSSGTVLSPVFGPAKGWKEVHWRGSKEEPNSDRATVNVIGINKNGVENVLYQLNENQMDFDISLIDPEQYPYLRLKLNNTDSITQTPYQLQYWRINYDPVPEGSLMPNAYLSVKDTLDIGEKLNFGVAFKNISNVPFDSIKVKVIVIDEANTSHILPLTARVKPLSEGDSVHFRCDIDSKNFPGSNTLSVDFNPDNDQPEQQHFNNFLYRNFYVRPDLINPLLDVTFDGVHILNRDIVSSKPHIQIKVKDEAKFMLLNDTSIVKELTVRYPDVNNTVKSFKFDGDTLRFTPSESGSDNVATIDFSPYFPMIMDNNNEPLNPDGDDYELNVKAKDKSGNNAGSIEYKVSFRVIDKPMISNLLNYPNPFTTSTAFVFTLTGSEIPQNLKIQILTVTGKIVREITKEELGPLRIGRNITEFKWNGSDQYGQRLANGVYLYRVVTMLHGKRMDKFKAENDNTDKYFNRGYGKMYLMK